MSILIVDDIEGNLYLLQTLLQGNGYEVVSATNGSEALKILEKGGVESIISDILMPVMDGFQLCRKVKSADEYSHIPFIFYTATYTDPKDEEFALKLGADKFVIKPCEPDSLMAIIKEVMTETETAGKSLEPAQVEEAEIFKLYSERLVKKLEKKMLDAEKEIVARKKAEKELKEANDELRALDEMRNNFLSNISHELRTPLVSIKGYAELTRNKVQESGKRVWLDRVISSCNQLEKVIEALLDISSLYHGEMQFDKSSFRIGELIKSSLEIIQPKIIDKRIAVRTNIPDDLPSVLGDENSIVSVLLNLIDNAIKFSDEKQKVEISVRQTEEQSIEVSVRDYGLGIPPEHQERIFDRFYQIESTSTRRYEGAGIGLALVKEIVGIHNGSVRVESTPGGGSVFSITLPISKSS